MVLKNINPIAKKSLFALITAIICTMLIVFIYFWGKPGKIFGIILFTLISIFAVFEFVKSFQLPFWAKVFLSLSSVFVVLTPLNNDFINFINVDNKILTQLPNENWPNPEYSSILIELIQEQFSFSVASVPFIGFPILIILILIPCLFIKDKSKILSSFFTILIIVILISFATKFLLYLTILQFSLILILISSVILTDSLAYFGGKLFGNKIFKRKLAPNISPNKTIEGAIAGFVGSFLFLLLFFWLNYAKINYGFDQGINFGKLSELDPLILLIIIPIIVPIFAILGDLLFSFTKRRQEIKDFSNLIPSHGGLLDRFDSLIMVIFVFGILIAILGAFVQ
ncbi:MAG: phosphatidate cytidylyltransferase [Mycoplasmataceae bacterium]|nr:phosphatidate cytidylyltransferase [Mycoplasmataceae bacterium]